MVTVSAIWDGNWVTVNAKYMRLSKWKENLIKNNFTTKVSSSSTDCISFIFNM